MMNKQEMQAFRELFSKYCRQEINKGHCESDGCEFCSVNSAYDEIFNRSPMTKKMTRMNRRQMEHDGPRV